MRIALNSGIYPAAWSPLEKLEATARSGAVGLELNVDATQLWTRRLDGPARGRLAERARELGIVWTSLCLNAHWVFNLASPDVRIRDVGISLLLESIDLACDLGAKVILVPGCDQEESPANEWDLFRGAVMQGVTRAEQAGVVLALEAVGKPFLYDSAKLRQMVDACGGSRALGLYLDAGNAAFRHQPWADEVRLAGDRLAGTVHVKDWVPGDRSRWYLGAGSVDLAATIATLREAGYDGYLVVELPPDPRDPEKIANDAVRYLEEMLK